MTKSSFWISFYPLNYLTHDWAVEHTPTQRLAKLNPVSVIFDLTQDVSAPDKTHIYHPAVQSL